MTAIAYKDGILAADTQSVWGRGTISSLNMIKVWHGHRGALVGSSGSFAFEGVYKRATESPEFDWRSWRSESDDFEGIFIHREIGTVIFPGTLPAFLVPKDTPYVVLGVADQFLEGAMAAGASAAEAVALAIRCRADCGGEVLCITWQN